MLSDASPMTDVVLMKEAEVATLTKELLDSSTNTDPLKFIDAQTAGAIAQNCCYLIHQEKELEAELSKKEEQRKNQRIFTKLYEDTLSDEKREVLEKLKKYLQFDKWNVETNDDKSISYSSKTPAEIINSRNLTNESDQDLH